MEIERTLGFPFFGGKLLYCIDPLRDHWLMAYDLKEAPQPEGIEKDAPKSYSYRSHLFDHQPSHQEVCDLLYGAINDACDQAILQGGSYTTLEERPHSCRLWLNQQNQFNWKAIYDMAKHSGGANLPAIIKLGITDEDAYYYTITTMRQLEHFILSVFKYIETTLASCWSAKQSLDLTPYTLDNGTEEQAL